MIASALERCEGIETLQEIGKVIAESKEHSWLAGEYTPLTVALNNGHQGTTVKLVGRPIPN
jgi:hypothetical protein